MGWVVIGWVVGVWVGSDGFYRLNRSILSQSSFIRPLILRLVLTTPTARVTLDQIENNKLHDNKNNN